MNAARRKRIEEVMSQLEPLKELVDDLLSEEQDAYESMPEGLKSSARGEAAENAVASLESASGQLEEAINELSAAKEAA
jgi:hypothetical protein